MARLKKRGKGQISQATALGEAHRKVMAQVPAGEGRRFKSLAAKLKKKGARNPKALAAWIGRRKYGKGRFQKMAAQGRKKRG